jgi:uncharacterized protein YndB with AHSA1/START domain
MPHPFELRMEVEVDATPDQIWEAIATGAGLDGWYIATGNAVEPRVGGTVRIGFGGDAAGEHPVTVWDPPRHFAHRGEPGPDGTFHAMEYVIEARAGGTTIVRMVHSGFLADYWEAEYDALNEGDYMYLRQMAEYVTHFRGRPVTFITDIRPTEKDRGLQILRAALGITDAVKEGDSVRFSVEGLPSIDGVVDFVSPSILGIRTSDALYRFSFQMGVVYIGHRIFGNGVDEAAATAAWQGWLDRSFA